MKIGIIGQGFVGTAVNEGLKQYHKIETYDITKTSTCNSLEELVEISDIIFWKLRSVSPLNFCESVEIDIII